MITSYWFSVVRFLRVQVDLNLHVRAAFAAGTLLGQHVFERQVAHELRQHVHLDLRCILAAGFGTIRCRFGHRSSPLN